LRAPLSADGSADTAASLCPPPPLRTHRKAAGGTRMYAQRGAMTAPYPLPRWRPPGPGRGPGCGHHGNAGGAPQDGAARSALPPTPLPAAAPPALTGCGPANGPAPRLRSGTRMRGGGEGGHKNGGALLGDGGDQDGAARFPDLPPPPPLPPPRSAGKMAAPARGGKGDVGRAPRPPTTPRSLPRAPPSGKARMRRPKMAEAAAAAQYGGRRGTRMRPLSAARRSRPAPHLQAPAARGHRAPPPPAAAALSGTPPPLPKAETGPSAAATTGAWEPPFWTRLLHPAQRWRFPGPG
ncbi:basic proline-rich protein-like, partial [Pezoporus wallicus]|uniref:basic proline-rich protein-like n=1 Tax=Pezoporus wallicus TaxID=35540 RepID=UPI00254B0AF4